MRKKICACGEEMGYRDEECRWCRRKFNLAVAREVLRLKAEKFGMTTTGSEEVDKVSGIGRKPKPKSQRDL